MKAFRYVSLLVVCLTCTSTPVLLGGDGEQTEVPERRSKVKESMRKLWREGIEVPKAQKDETDLGKTIRKLRSIQFPPRTKPPTPTSQPSTQPSTAPSETTTAQATPQATSRPAAPKMDPKLLERLKQLTPKDVPDPRALGDALYLAGYRETARGFYEMALGQSDEPEDSAWLLFQMGNCLHASDPTAAVGVYRRLMAEHPDSTWSSLAGARAMLIEWYQFNKPRAVLSSAEFRIGPGSSGGTGTATK